MNLFNFEKEIESKIVKRGRSYFKNHYIQNVLQVTHGRYSAVVSGTKNYSVSVRLNNSLEIVESSCSCPYDWGAYCKHEVAVFYHIKENNTLSSNTEDSSLRIIKATLKRLKKKEIVDLILDLAERNKDFRENMAEELL
ncbi:MAG: SWIM zinc finger family protein [Chitinophagales bacterium]